MNLQCKHREWVPERQGLMLIPDCERNNLTSILWSLRVKFVITLAICNPPCLNGGNCLSFNVCQCTKEFRGQQCQWGTERCDTAKLNFNGAFSCSGSADSLICKLNCPKNINFEFPPADSYTCAYGTGEFVPKNVPRCVFGEIVCLINRHHYWDIKYSFENFVLNEMIFV